VIKKSRSVSREQGRLNTKYNIRNKWNGSTGFNTDVKRILFY